MLKNLHKILPRIYDAALNETHWRGALDAVAEATEAKGAVLFALDKVGLPFAVQQFSSAYRPEYLQYYIENLAKYEEEGFQKLMSLPVRTFVMDTEIWPDVARHGNRPDYEWMRKNVGILRRGSARLNDLPGFVDTVGLQFPDSMEQIPRELIEYGELLFPHLAKAVELHRSFAILKSRFDAVLGALDHVKIGVCITSGHGDVIVSNKEARRIIDIGDGLTLGRDSRLRCSDPSVEARLANAIREAVLTVKGSSNTHETLIGVKRRSCLVPLLLEVSPLSDSVGELDPTLRGAIVFIIDPQNPRPFSTRAVSQAFGLSTALAEVCNRMVDGYTDKEIADMRGVSVETIRSQMKAVYEKTHTRRRADLVRVALSVTPPIDPTP